jgi:hypothetical protein
MNNIEINDVVYLAVLAGTILLLAFIPSRIARILKKRYVGEVAGQPSTEQIRKSRIFSVVSVLLIIPYGLFICPLVVYVAIVLMETILKGGMDWR